MEKHLFYLNEEKTATLECFILAKSHEMPIADIRPAVVVCPGGGYWFCSDREAEPVALAYSGDGFHSFIVRYSVNEKAVFPTPLVELSKAIKIIRENADDWGVDKEKIAVCGFSAGGHLTASLGVHWNNPEVMEKSDCKNGENKPNALILGYPVISTSWIENAKTLDRIIGDRDYDSTYEMLNLHLHIGKHTPPSFLFHTVMDDAVPVRDSLNFAAGLDKNDVLFEMHIFPNNRHGLSLATDILCEGKGDKDFSKWHKMSCDWLWRMFYGKEKELQLTKAKYSSKF